MSLTTPTIHVSSSARLSPADVWLSDGVSAVNVHVADEPIPGLRPTWLVFTVTRAGTSEPMVATGECGCP